MKTVETIVLELDAQDAAAVREAINLRTGPAFSGDDLIPPGGGNREGRVLAEICRGWMEMLEARA